MATSSFEINLKTKDALGNPIKVENGYLSKENFANIWNDTATTTVDFKEAEVSGEACKFEIEDTQFLYVQAEDGKYLCFATDKFSKGKKVGVLKSVSTSSKSKDAFGNAIGITATMNGGAKVSITRGDLLNLDLIPTKRTDKNYFKENFVPLMKETSENFKQTKKTYQVECGDNVVTLEGGKLSNDQEVVVEKVSEEIVDDIPGLVPYVNKAGCISNYTIYAIQRPRARGEGDDTDLAFLVVSKHPNPNKAATGEKSCYYIENLAVNGEKIDFSDPQAIISAGGKVVNRIYTGVLQRNRMAIKLYKDDKVIDNKTIKALRPEYVDEINAEIGKTPNKIVTGVKPFTKKVAVGIVSLAVAATAVVGVFHAQIYMGENQSAQAKEWGKTQVSNMLLDGDKFFNYKDGAIVGIADGTNEVINNKMSYYTQQGFLGRMNKSFKASYKEATRDGYFYELGQRVAKELNKNGIRVVKPVVEANSNGEVKYEPVYTYLISSFDSDVNNRKTMKNWIVQNYSFTDAHAEIAMKSYEEGFKEACAEAVAENPTIKDDVPVYPPIEEDPSVEPDVPVVENKIDFADATIADAIYNEIVLVDTKISKENMEIEYASLEDGKIFVTSGNYLYEIDVDTKALKDVDTTEEYVDAISGNVVGLERSTKAEVAFKNIANISAYMQAWAKPFGDNGSVYISRTEPQLDESGEYYTFSPIATVVYEDENGVTCVNSFEADGITKVKVSDLGGKVSIGHANAVALLYEDFGYIDNTGKLIYQENTEGKAWGYSANSIPAEEVKEGASEIQEAQPNLDEEITNGEIVEENQKVQKTTFFKDERTLG